jgi:hypothetical protein
VNIGGANGGMVKHGTKLLYGSRVMGWFVVGLDNTLMHGDVFMEYGASYPK